MSRRACIQCRQTASLIMGSTVFCGVARIRCRQGKSHADAMVVICLYSMLIYSPIKSPKSLIFFFQIEKFKSSGDFFFFSLLHIAIYIAEKKKYRNVSFFQYRAALLLIIRTKLNVIYGFFVKCTERLTKKWPNLPDITLLLYRIES